MVATLLSLQAYAGADKGGNGGGGFCYSAGKCVTLAEAGLRVPQDIPLFMISEEAEKEVRGIVGALPKNSLFGGFWGVDDNFEAKHLIDRALGGRDTFVSVDQSNIPAFENIIKEYKSLIQQYAPHLPAEKFSLFAVSDSQKEITYLLPQFFKLTPHQQALILIHESFVRAKGSKIMPLALRLDGLIYDCVHSDAKPDRLELFLAYYNWYAQANRLTTHSYQLFRDLVTILSDKAGRPLLAMDLSPSWISGQVSEVGREEALAGNKNLDPRFAKIFYGAKFKVFDRTDLLDGDGPASDFFIDPKVCPGKTAATENEVLVNLSLGTKNGGTRTVLLQCDHETGTKPVSVRYITDIEGIHTF
jgi:hypothetical protein